MTQPTAHAAHGGLKGWLVYTSGIPQALTPDQARKLAEALDQAAHDAEMQGASHVARVQP